VSKPVGKPLRTGAPANGTDTRQAGADANWAALAERASRLYTGALTDVLDELGEHSRTLPPNLLPLRKGMRLAGPAFPVEGVPAVQLDRDASIRGILTMLGEVTAHHVLVYQTHDEACTAAHLGELSVVALRARGCAGAVIDGGCRDIEEILGGQEFPVFCRYTTPADAVPRWQIQHWNAPVTIGSVRVEPGAYLVADRDGIVVIPAALLEEVLARAEEVVATENEIREAVREGVSPLEAYDRYGIF
jgi:4-hydroxy-4-methyl-2-oxoglutarate aldolase